MSLHLRALRHFCGKNQFLNSLIWQLFLQTIRVIIFKIIYCQVSLIFFLSQITLAVEKTSSYQMLIYTVNHNVSYEVMMVRPINPILKSYKYVYVTAYSNSREAAKIGHQIK